MLNSIRHLLRSEAGQATPEYAVLLSMLAVLAIAMTELSDEVKKIFESATGAFKAIGDSLEQVPDKLTAILSK